ncbi:uncharacterized protein BCR38DRAFT_458855 [Pseudomassariella vexata]|uniref:Uncharacterized protein n=1 Tax=Pseudomassariella vexata TaxID=1141098 RepID=A0A1Y2DSP7_9PEZI|nr:uncharacterized protein BCR38DRAFT_458855 [Pseudomassariella vexata]ORY62292.1 hypothetical protein BCR38DRAFT_458855 [Pseudomassariella vexata]
MQTSRFQSIRSRFSPAGIRTSLRRASSASWRSDSSSNSFMSTGSPVETINSVMFRQPSIVGMVEEKKSFAEELNLLEPRPIVYWGGLEERMGSF